MDDATRNPFSPTSVDFRYPASLKGSNEHPHQLRLELLQQGLGLADVPEEGLTHDVVEARDGPMIPRIVQYGAATRTHTALSEVVGEVRRDLLREEKELVRGRQAEAGSAQQRAGSGSGPVLPSRPKRQRGQGPLLQPADAGVTLTARATAGDPNVSYSSDAPQRGRQQQAPDPKGAGPHDRSRSDRKGAGKGKDKGKEKGKDTPPPRHSTRSGANYGSKGGGPKGGYRWS